MESVSQLTEVLELPQKCIVVPSQLDQFLWKIEREEQCFPHAEVKLI